MKLVVFNGSPRREKGNSRILLDKFLQGFETAGGTFEIYYLKDLNEHQRYAELFFQADAVLLAFPLYTDAMPGIVKAFMDELKMHRPSSDETGARKQLFFLVHSGFPEAKHTTPVSLYLMKLAKRLNYDCPGVIQKGGSEGMQDMPARAREKIYRLFFQLGSIYGQTGKLDGECLQKIRGMEKIPWYLFPVLWVLQISGVFDLMFNKELKKHGSFAKRYDQPYWE
jgi:hypothetical protein